LNVVSYSAHTLLPTLGKRPLAAAAKATVLNVSNLSVQILDLGGRVTSVAFIPRASCPGYMP
jgi:hypothetical protein